MAHSRGLRSNPNVFAPCPFLFVVVFFSFFFFIFSKTNFLINLRKYSRQNTVKCDALHSGVSPVFLLLRVCRKWMGSDGCGHLFAYSGGKLKRRNTVRSRTWAWALVVGCPQVLNIDHYAMASNRVAPHQLSDRELRVSDLWLIPTNRRYFFVSKNIDVAWATETNYAPTSLLYRIDAMKYSHGGRLYYLIPVAALNRYLAKRR